MQSLSSILGITIAVLFITAQISSRPRYARTITEIYANKTTFVILSLFFLAISTGIASLAFVSLIVESGDYRILSFNVLVSTISIAFLCPLTLIQIENLSPYLLAMKLAKRVKPLRIYAYQLAQVDIDQDSLGKLRYSLLVWGHDHGRDDPLGPFHEVIMGAVESRDRIQLSALVRLLLQRIARYSAVPYPAKPASTLSQTSEEPKWFNSLYLFAFAPVSPVDQLRVALHLLHYIVRRAHNLRREWGNLDTVRQQFILNIGDLIQSLNLRKGTEQIIDICLFSVMHICLGYADVPRYGRLEPLRRYYQISKELAASNKCDQALLSINRY